MFCPNCGTQLPDGSRFCPSCGFSLTGDTPADPSHPKPPVQAPQQPSYQQVPPEPKQQRQPLNWPAFIRTMTTGDVRNLSLAGLQAALLAALCGVIFITQDAEGLPRVFDTGSSGSVAVTVFFIILMIAALVLLAFSITIDIIQLARRSTIKNLAANLITDVVVFGAAFFLIPTYQTFYAAAKYLGEYSGFYDDFTNFVYSSIPYIDRYPSAAASITVLALSAIGIAVILSLDYLYREPAE
ncbi:MAG: zinc-ribbon domain-containing protein [Acutalibacteraceae bacterium]